MKAWSIVVLIWITIWVFEDIHHGRNIFDRYNVKVYGIVAVLRLLYLISGFIWIF